MTLPLVHIIIVNWNSWHDTAECIKSCKELLYDSFNVVVVDNASSDGSAARLRELFPTLEMIVTAENLGFAGGNNVGIKHAFKRHADFVWLLNNDTTVDPNALSALVAVAEADPSVGMVGSKIVYHGDPTMLWYAGASLDASAPHCPRHIGLNEKDGGQYDTVLETGYVTGCSLLARRKMIESVGVLDDEMFLYFEDVDWSARAKAAGWKLVYEPGSLVYHKVSHSSGGAASPTLLYYTSRNRLYFVKRNFPKKLAAAFLYDLYEHVLVNVKKRRFRAAWAALAGISDFCRGKTGRRGAS